MTDDASGAAPRWGLAIIHHRDPEAVRRLLQESRTWSARPSVTIVVDNSADLGDVGADAQVVVPPSNLGYAGAANLALARLADLVPGAARMLLCTQDASLRPDAVEALHAAMDDRPACAVAAPLLAYASAPDTVFSAGGRLSRRGIGTHPHQGSPRAAQQSGAVEVDWVDGAITLLDIAAVRDVGGYDPDYFLYVEEIDLQTRLRLAGRTVVLVRDAVGYQEPGSLPSYLKYRNGVYLTRKLAHDLAPWPVLPQLLRDSARAALRARPFSPIWAVRGALDARRGRMGPPPRRSLQSREVTRAG